MLFCVTDVELLLLAWITTLILVIYGLMKLTPSPTQTVALTPTELLVKMQPPALPTTLLFTLAVDGKIRLVLFLNPDEQEELWGLARSVARDARREGKRMVVSYGRQYSYSRKGHGPRVFPKWLEVLKSKVEEQVGHSLTQCSITFYSDAESFIALHGDNEKSIVPGSQIAGIS